MNDARVAELSRKAAVARYFPSLSVDADYVLGGSHASTATPVADVSAALLSLQSSAEQVNVARSNIDLAEQTLVQSRDRFSAGATDTVEVVQPLELVASAHEPYISSLYNYNYAKISLLRALGIAEQGVKEYFRGK